MCKGRSESIVAFIANLLPLYQGEQHEGRWCARSLTDGTLILPIVHPDAEDDDDGWVMVYWQGDPARQSVTLASKMASLAIARYVELHHTATFSKLMRDEMEHMSQHFTLKTGAHLMFELPDSGLMDVVGEAVRKFGEAVVIEILKNKVGL